MKTYTGLGAVPLMTLLMLVWVSCAEQSAVESWDALEAQPDAPEAIEPAIHWHQRYVEENCARCPECCVAVVEDGFIDEYGVKRPLDWLPGDVDDCYDCPGPECVCVMDGSGRWWIDATIGDDD